MNRRWFLLGAIATPLAPTLAKIVPVAPAPLPVATLAVMNGGTGSTLAAELAAVTRAAFVPKLVAQIYRPSPLLSAMMRSGEFADCQ